MITRDILFSGTAFQIAVEMRRAQRHIIHECSALRENWHASLRDRSLFPHQADSARALPFMPACKESVHLSKTLYSKETAETAELFNRISFGLSFPTFISSFLLRFFTEPKKTTNNASIHETCKITSISQQIISLQLGNEQIDLPLRGTLEDLSKVIEHPVYYYEKEKNKRLESNSPLSSFMLPGNCMEIRRPNSFHIVAIAAACKLSGTLCYNEGIKNSES